MSVHQSSRPLLDLISRTSSSNYICRQCKQSLKWKQNTSQARYASTTGPNSHRSKRLREWKKPVRYPLYPETNPGENITKIAQPTKEEFDTEGNPIFQSTWNTLKVIPVYKDAKDLPNRIEDEYTPWQTNRHSSISQESIISFLFQAIVECYASKISAPSVLSEEYLKSISIAISTDGTLNKPQFPKYDAEVLAPPADSAPPIKVASQDSLDSEKADYIENRDGTLVGEAVAEASEPGAEQTVSQEPQFENYYQPSKSQQSFLEAQINLKTPRTFEILKRFSLLLGQRIPDPLLTELSRPPTNNYQHLVDSLYEHIKPKPANVAETLALNSELSNQANVLVVPRKERFKDKQQEVGRWKVIVKELGKRDMLFARERRAEA